MQNATVPGTSNNGSACGASFDERYNPSNTGNIRINSRFSLTDKLTLFVDPSFQYTKANGGGTVTAREGCPHDRRRRTIRASSAASIISVVT